MIDPMLLSTPTTRARPSATTAERGKQSAFAMPTGGYFAVLADVWGPTTVDSTGITLLSVVPMTSTENIIGEVSYLPFHDVLHWLPSSVTRSIFSLDDLSTPAVESFLIAPQNPANRLRDTTGLTVDKLANLCGVSRQAYHAWLRGNPVTKEREERLLRMGALVEAAAQHRGRGDELRRWLLSPVVGTTQTPLDFLQANDEDTFLGLALRAQRLAASTPTPSDLEAKTSGVPIGRLRRMERRLRPAERTYVLEREANRGWREDTFALDEPARQITEVAV